MKLMENIALYCFGIGLIGGFIFGFVSVLIGWAFFGLRLTLKYLREEYPTDNNRARNFMINAGTIVLPLVTIWYVTFIK